MQIPENEILSYMRKLKISHAEAVDLWLSDHDLAENEEQNALDEKASKVKVNHGAGVAHPRKPSAPRKPKVSVEKAELFKSILANIDRCTLVERENVQVITENKLIFVQIGQKKFKIDLIECRK